MHKDDWNVATSKRRDVATPQRRDVPTSRRPNVVTSQRRDVATSRRQCELFLSIIKSKRGPEFEGGSEIKERMN